MVTTYENIKNLLVLHIMIMMRIDKANVSVTTNTTTIPSTFNNGIKNQRKDSQHIISVFYSITERARDCGGVYNNTHISLVGCHHDH